MRITTKLTLIISCLLMVLFITLAWASYRHDQALALQETVDEARTIARQIVEIREYLSLVVRVEQVEQNAGLTPSGRHPHCPAPHPRQPLLRTPGVTALPQPPKPA